MAQEVLIDFVVDYSQLDKAIDTLEKTGQVDKKVSQSFKETNAAIAQQGTALKKTAQEYKGPITSLDQLDKRTKKFVSEFVKGFEEGVKAELLLAKKEIDGLREKFESAGKATTKSTTSLRQELKNLTQQIALAKANGTDLGTEYQKLVARAGELKDAMADASAEIANAGSDTRGLDNLLGSAQALAGGFAVLQGSAALFGDESEEMQKTLLKVNAAMAILQGLQSIQNALQKEGAVTKTLENVQQKIAIVQTGLESAAQSKNIIVKGAATVAQKAFNAAVSANPLGLLVTALLVVIPLLLKYAENTREAAAATAALDAGIASSKEGLLAQEEALNRAGEEALILAERRGDKETEIIKQQITNLKQLVKARQDQFEINAAILAQGGGDAEKRLELEKEQQRITKQLQDDQLTSMRLNTQLQKAAAAEQEEAVRAREEASQKAAAAERQRIQDAIARLKTEQLQVDEGTLTYKRLEAAIVTLQGKYASLGASAAEATFAQASAAKQSEQILRDQSSAVDVSLNKIEKGTVDTTKAIQAVSGQAAATITETFGAVEEGLEETFTTFLDNIIPELYTGLYALQQVSQGLNQISQERQNNQQIEIENQRRQVDELLEAGAITEKEAAARQKRIDQIERVQRTKAAQQAKQLAIFAAIISTAQAVVNALATPPAPVGIALAAVVGALGAAQIAAIASRPIPKFAKGKKDQYEGLGIVGEAGSELIEQGGQMYVAAKPTLVYLGKRDKVYTPHETRAMLPKVSHGDMRPVQAQGFDYDRMARMMPQSKGTTINIDKDFITEAVENGLLKTNYYTRRYSSK